MKKYAIFWSFSPIKVKTQARLLKNYIVYGADIVTVNHAPFRFRRFPFDNFDVKDAPRPGTLFRVTENVIQINWNMPLSLFTLLQLFFTKKRTIDQISL